MTVDLWIWAVFLAGVAGLLLFDLVAFGRGEIPIRRALWWSAGWTALGLAFTAVVWSWRGAELGQAYLAGFVVEKSLSLDNLFVFAVLFTALAIPLAERRRILLAGIAGAIVLRGLFILAGAALLDAFHFTIYVLGAFLIATGVRMAFHRHDESGLEHSRIRRSVERLLPATSAAFVLVMVFDVVFALDSIPAIFAITRDTFVVFAANAFSLLGLQALYWVLADAIGRFRYLNVGLAAVLVFVGAKMAASDHLHLPVWLSLLTIVAILGTAIAASLRSSAPSPGPTSATPSTSTATASGPASSGGG